MPRPDYAWKLPREISDRLGTESYGAQRALCEQDHLLLVLHEPPVKEGNEREHRVFLRQPDGTWLFQGNPQGERTLVDLVEHYDKVLSSLEGRYQQARSAADLFQLLDRLMPMARAATNMKDALQSARESTPGDKLLITLRDRAVEVARGLELLLANARLALEYQLARQSEEQTRAAMAGTQAQLKLNTLAALTFPLMTLAAVFGMNLPSGLESQPAWMFWAVFGAGLMLGLGVKSWVRSIKPAGTGTLEGSSPKPSNAKPSRPPLGKPKR